MKISLFLGASDGTNNIAESQASEDLLETKSTQKAIKEATKTKTVELKRLLA
jgi:hypothetical protein